jgi:hypothetical protein
MWNDTPRVTRDVVAPNFDETIDISVDTRQYEIRISEDIAKNIKWQTVKYPTLSLIKRFEINKLHMLSEVSPLLLRQRQMERHNRSQQLLLNRCLRYLCYQIKRHRYRLQGHCMLVKCGFWS